MGRSFPFTVQGRALRICPLAIEEAWELWILDGERPLICARRISIDESVEAGLRGEDRIRTVAEELMSRFVTPLPELESEAGPSPWAPRR
jgi:hypothetical protein